MGIPIGKLSLVRIHSQMLTRSFDIIVVTSGYNLRDLNQSTL